MLPSRCRALEQALERRDLLQARIDQTETRIDALVETPTPAEPAAPDRLASLGRSGLSAAGSPSRFRHVKPLPYRPSDAKYPSIASSFSLRRPVTTCGVAEMSSTRSASAPKAGHSGSPSPFGSPRFAKLVQ